LERIKVLSLLSLLLLLAGVASAQESSVNYFFTACETNAIVELDGTMGAGYDLYVQFFAGAGGTGDELTGLTRISVNGTYDITRVVNYSSGKTAALGQLISMYIALAPEGNPDGAVYTDIVDDFQDTCAEPATGTQTIGGVDANAEGTGIDPSTGETVNVPAGELISSSGIPKPNGGILNEIFALPNENTVQIGARYSERFSDGNQRMPDAGLIYAQCRDASSLAAPGILYDTDNLTLYWNWWAVEAEQVYDHMRNVTYNVVLSGQRVTEINVSPVVQREDGYYYVFYTAPLGDGWRPDGYWVNMEIRWQQPISDGVSEYGPGTETEVISTGCDFSVVANPYGVQVQQKNPSVPLQREFIVQD
jgi:hypothetical protein